MRLEEKKKRKKKHTEHERMCVFGTLSTRGRYYAHAPHTEHEGEYLFGSDIQYTRARHNAPLHVYIVNTMN